MGRLFGTDGVRGKANEVRGDFAVLAASYLS